jgi:CBS domain-containing protein
MKIEAVMNKAVISLSPDDTILKASLKLSEKSISGAPVVNAEGTLVGIFSEADVFKSMKISKKALRLIYPSLTSVSVAFQEQETEQEALAAYKEVENLKVGDVMTTEVFTAHPDDELRDAIKLMVSKSINRLPVINGNNKVIGIITRGDILKGIAMESNNHNSHQ